MKSQYLKRTENHLVFNNQSGRWGAQGGEGTRRRQRPFRVPGSAATSSVCGFRGHKPADKPVQDGEPRFAWPLSVPFLFLWPELITRPT